MPRQKEIIIIKLGGSIVTEKSAEKPVIRTNHVTKIARIIAKHYNPQRYSLILIHGAGSYGHLHAYRHKLSLGTKDHPEKTFRATENQYLDARLNSELTTIFIQEKLPVVGMPTRTLAINKNGALASLSIESIEAAIRVGVIPLLHGDMVFDQAWGLSILSGDTLMVKLAEHFNTKKVFFASDVDGIFSEDPHLSKKAKFIPRIHFDKIGKELVLGQSHHRDVTGGLSKKFSALYTLPSLKKIFFFNGLKVLNFSFLFSQKNFSGTIIDKK